MYWYCKKKVLFELSPFMKGAPMVPKWIAKIFFININLTISSIPHILTWWISKMNVNISKYLHVISETSHLLCISSIGTFFKGLSAMHHNYFCFFSKSFLFILSNQLLSFTSFHVNTKIINTYIYYICVNMYEIMLKSSRFL